MSNHHRFHLYIFVPLLLVVGCAQRVPTPTPADQAAVDRLLLLMKDRLLIMHDVARTKWNSGKPIADPLRESALLDAVAKRGAAHGLDETTTRAFFAAQIEASKMLQEKYFARWRESPPTRFAGAPSLTELRDRLDDLNEKLLSALADVQRRRGGPAFRELLRARSDSLLTGEAIDARIRHAATAPLID